MIDPLTAAWLVKHFGLNASMTYRSKATTQDVTISAPLNTLLDLAKGIYPPDYCKRIEVNSEALPAEKLEALKQLGFVEAV